MHSPVEEQAALRGTTLFSGTALTMGKNESLWLGQWTEGLGKQAEIVILFTRPKANTIFGVDVMAGKKDHIGSAIVSTRIFVQHKVGKKAVQVGVTSGSSNLNIPSGGPR